MDDFFHMHNRMAQNFFAQADRDFQRFLEPPRPVRQHPVREQRRQQQDYRVRRSDTFTNAYREPRHQNRISGNNNFNNNRSRRTNNNDVRRKNNNNNNNRNSNQSTYQRKPQKFDRGTLKREGILATRPSTSSHTPCLPWHLAPWPSPCLPLVEATSFSKVCRVKAPTKPLCLFRATWPPQWSAVRRLPDPALPDRASSAHYRPYPPE